MRLFRPLLPCLFLACLFANPLRAADEDEYPAVPVITEANEPPVWWKYGRAEVMTTYTRLGKTQRTYEYPGDRIVEKVWRADDTGEWLPLPDAVNTYNADFSRVLRAEYAFDEDGISEEWRDYDYDKLNRLLAIRVLRRRQGKPEEEISRIEFERDADGQVATISRHEHGAVFVEQRHRYESGPDGPRHVIEMTYPEAKTLTTVYAGNRRVEYTETRAGELLARLRYDDADRPAEEWRYEDAEHFEHRQWVYRDGILIRVIQDFSRSSLPELGSTTYEYRYRYGRLSNYVKADAQRRALEKTVIAYVHEPVFDDGASLLPEDMAAWWHFRPAHVTDIQKTTAGETRRDYVMHWDEHGCSLRFSETWNGDDRTGQRGSAAYTRDGRLQSWISADGTTIRQIPNDALPRRLTTKTTGRATEATDAILRTYNDNGNLATTAYQTDGGDILLEEARYGANDSGALTVIVHALTGIEERRQSDVHGTLQIVEWLRDGAVLQRLRCTAEGLPAQMQWFTVGGTPVQTESFEYEQQRLMRSRLDVWMSLGNLQVGSYETVYRYRPDGALVELRQTDADGAEWRRLQCDYDR